MMIVTTSAQHAIFEPRFFKHLKEASRICRIESDSKKANRRAIQQSNIFDFLASP